MLEVDNKAVKTVGDKLANIYFNLDDLIHKHDLNYYVKEQGFSRYNKATQALFKVVGVVEFTLYCNRIATPIPEISPTKVKKLLTGNGKADKLEVQKAVRKYLIPSQKEMYFPSDNLSDAVAVGIAFNIMKKES